MLSASPQLADASQRSTIRHLRHKLTTVRAERNDLRNTLRTVRIDRDILRDRVRSLETDNARLREGLPNAILAVPMEDFGRLVFTPARQAWPCDSVYSSPDYWSITFESGC